MKTLIQLAEELEDAAQFENSDYGVRLTATDVAAELRKISAQQEEAQCE